ncbi:hypothetical protein EDB92DRAFT_1816997 [Lactarius akahatsu]|uniref:Uncharacterized protein n=1 Tax=Lactarius akahatsu TaxID=416441 RepID=A0AAD4LDK9_9AGAM|nr:hypothetical protein EDB92DRAFT_1816997 [Lactarius akahatsu]
MSPCSDSLILPPPSPAVLSALALKDERPPLPDVIDLCDDEDETNLDAPYLPTTSPTWRDASTLRNTTIYAPLGNDSDDESSPLADIIDFYFHDDNDIPSSSALLGIADDTQPSGGVKPSTASVSKPNPPRHHPLFPRHALEQPRDPDEITPTTSISLPPPPGTAITPLDHPLRAHVREKRAYDADEENPRKRLTPPAGLSDKAPAQVLHIPTPSEETKAQTRRAADARHSEGVRTPDRKLPKLEDDEPQYDWIRQHLAYRYRPGAKEAIYQSSPFPVTSPQQSSSTTKSTDPSI